VPVLAAEVLLERETEVARLDALVAEVPAGRGRLLLLEGPAGIGKTRLLRAARERAAEAALRILTARGSELEREFPFGLVRQLFEPPLAAAELPRRRALLQGAASLAAPIVGLGHRAEELPAGGAMGDPSFPTLHGLYWLTSNLTDEGPLLLAVDDAHWSDRASLRFLRFLVTRLEELPVLLALAYRPDEPGADAGLLAELASDPVTELVRPAPLSAGASADFVRVTFSADAEPEFCDACQRASGGNPFLLSELVRELGAQRVEPTARQAEQVRSLAPRTVARAVLLRVARLGEEASELARAAAVLGDPAELRRASALADIPMREASDAADALGRAGVLAPGRPLAFIHPLVRAAIYSDIAAGELAAAHARAARLLADDGAGADEVAVHLLEADPGADRAVVETLRSAAREAVGRGALDVAVRYLRRALAEPPAEDARASLLLELGSLEAAVYEPSAVDHLRAAVQASPDDGSRIASTRALARALIAGGRVRDALDEGDRAIALAEPTDRELALEIEAELLTAGQVTYALPAHVVAERLARLEPIEGRTPAERMLLVAKAYELARTGPAAAPAAELAERALADRRLLSRQPADSPLFYALTLVLFYTDGLDLADRCMERALADARARGSALGFAATSAARSYAALARGSIRDAEAEARNALDAEGPNGRIALPRALGFLIDALIERGELSAAEEALERSGMGTMSSDDPILIATLAISRGHLRLAQRRPADALDDLLAVGRSMDALGYRTPSATAVWARSWAALAHLQLGQRDEARRLAAVEVERARAFGAPRPLGIALRTLGLAQGGKEGMELLREAVSVLESSVGRLEHACALTDLGAALRRANRRSEARGPLREGLALARRCGALALVDRAREELSATGERVPRLTLPGPESLTPSERRIADMAAAGLSNKEIAQALFVTVKTVEAHLSHVFRKLDIESRKALKEALAETADPQPRHVDVGLRHR
jgi:DNA-binding CsgD family transcriptional regulator